MRPGGGSTRRTRPLIYLPAKGVGLQEPFRRLLPVRDCPNEQAMGRRNLHPRTHLPILTSSRFLIAPPASFEREPARTCAAERACLPRRPSLTRVTSSESFILLPAYFPLAHFWRNIFGRIVPRS